MFASVMTDLLWTAPEILRKKPNDAMRVNGTKPADVYSFGIIISELLTRELPYQIGMGSATLEGQCKSTFLSLFIKRFYGYELEWFPLEFKLLESSRRKG